MRKIIFGGTFDPVHNGHLALAGEVLARGIADKVIFVPAYVPPHKTERAVTAYKIRHKLLKEAIKDEPRFEISDIEKERGGKSYTIDTLRSMSKLFPDDCILLLIGADSLRQLHTWSRPKELLREFELACYPRQGEIPAAEELREHWTEDEIRKLLSCVIPDAPCFDLSSTEIRKRLAECPDSAKDMIPPAVFECMERNSYYNYKSLMENKMSETKDVKKPATVNKAEELAKLCEEIAYDRKAENIIRIELKELSSISDYFILCTGMNEPHISAISEKIRRDVLERLKIKPVNVDGSAKSHWIITDFGSVMVHAMTEETRATYQIESLWSDAPQIDAIQRLEKEAKKQASAGRKKAGE